MKHLLHAGLVLALALILVLAVNRAASSHGIHPHPTLVQSGRVCGNRDDMITQIRKTYGELPIGYGISQRGGLILEMLLNPETGSWTFLLIRPNKNACVVASGKDWSTEPMPYNDLLEPAVDERDG